MNSWTDEQAQKAVRRFLNGEDSKRYQSIYKDGASADEEIFLKDADRRTGTATGKAKDWWQRLQNAPALGKPERLALAEPFAQLGCSVDDLYRNLPAAESPDALLAAWRKIKDPNAIEGITNTAGWSDVKKKKYLEEVRKAIDWDNTTGSARKWWEAFENENHHQVSLVVRLAEELKLRKASITEFFLAYVYSNTDNIQANLHYLEYTRLKKKDKEREKSAAANPVETSGKKTEDESTWPATPGVPDTTGWSAGQIKERRGEVLEALDWANTTGSARKWWEEFQKENESRPAWVLRLMEELKLRKATITEFYLAYVYSNTDNIQAVLKYLDYTRLKKEEELQKKVQGATNPGGS
jgi:hypothetical protein